MPAPEAPKQETTKVETPQQVAERISKEEQVKVEDIQQLANSLNQPDALNPAAKAEVISSLEASLEGQIKPKCKDALTRAVGDILKKTPSERDQKQNALMKLFERWFPLDAIKMTAIQTSTPSDKAKDLFVKTEQKDAASTTIDDAKFNALLKNPESVRTMFESMNKGDIKLLLPALKAKLPKNDTEIKHLSDTAKIPEQQLKDTLKIVDAATGKLVDNMIKGGYIVDDPNTDIVFLSQHGGTATKEFIQKNKDSLAKSTKEAPLIIKGTGDAIKIEATIGADGKMLKGLDLSRVNKTNLDQVQKELVNDFGPQLEHVKANLSKLVDTIGKHFGAIGDILKTVLQMFGLYQEGGKIAPEAGKEKETSPGWKIERLGKMLNPKDPEKDLGYSLDKVKFDDQHNLEKPESAESQKYVEDVQKIVNIKETKKDSTGKESFTYGVETKKAVEEWQKKLFPGENQKITGNFDKDTAAALLKHLKPEPKSEPKPEPKAPEAVKSAIPEDKANALKLLEGKKTYKEMIGSVDSLKAIQTLVGAEPDGKIGPKTRAAIGEIQAKLGVKQDKNFGPKTLEALIAKKDILAEPTKPAATEAKK